MLKNLIDIMFYFLVSKMKKRLKDNAMLIVLCVVIICCTMSTNKKLDSVYERIDSFAYDTVLPWINDIYHVLDYIESAVENTDKKVKDIHLMLDWSLDDIVYYLGK